DPLVRAGGGGGRPRDGVHLPGVEPGEDPRARGARRPAGRRDHRGRRHGDRAARSRAGCSRLGGSGREAAFDRVASAVERRRSLPGDPERVAEEEGGLDFEDELLRVLALVELVRTLSVADGRLELVEPVGHEGEGAVANRTGTGVDLGNERCEEAAPGVRAAAAGATTSSSKSARAVSIVASWSSSFDPKWAKSPLLLMPTASASRAIESPSSPSTVASLAASRRIASRLRSPSERRLRGAGAACGGFTLDKLARPFV